MKINIPYDKFLHFVFSLFMAIVLSTILANATYQLAPQFPGVRAICAWVLTFEATLAVGVWKELRDRKQSGNHFCWRDLIADALGAFVGSWFAFATYFV